MMRRLGNSENIKLNLVPSREISKYILDLRKLTIQKWLNSKASGVFRGKLVSFTFWKVHKCRPP